MTPTGIIRNFDDLGRVHIPKSIRKLVFGTTDVNNISMEIYHGDGDVIILKPIKPIDNKA